MSPVKTCATCQHNTDPYCAHPSIVDVVRGRSTTLCSHMRAVYGLCGVKGRLHALDDKPSDHLLGQIIKPAPFPTLHRREDLMSPARIAEQFGRHIADSRA